MQNKSAIWFFTILLTLACLYQISFSWVASNVEEEAEKFAIEKADSLATAEGLNSFDKDSAAQNYESERLLNMASQPVYPLLDFDYNYVKKREINLGLDLQGGMNVTLEVSVIDLIKTMAGSNAQREDFKATLARAKELQKNSQDGVVELFGQAWSELYPNKKLASIFSTLNNKELIPVDASDEEVIDVIKREAEDAVIRTEQVLRKRVDNLGVVQPKIQRLTNSGRIIVELPGVKDKKRVREILQSTAKLEFWETYQLREEVSPALVEVNQMLGRKLAPKEDTASQSSEEDLLGDLADDSEDIASVEESVENDTATAESEDGEFDDLFADDSTTSDSTVTDMDEEEFRKNNPLFAIMEVPRFQNPNTGQVELAQGPIVGYSFPADTADVGELLRRKDSRKIIKSYLPRVKFLWGAKPVDPDSDKEYYALYAVKISKDGKAPLEGDKITNAAVTADELGNPAVSLTMNTSGAKAWKEMTRKAADNNGYIAVTLDNLIYSAPGVDEEIPTGNTRISGSFTQEEAGDLAGVLKAGKLPAPSNIIEEAIVGPSLGEESISDGLNSFLLALGIILIYMIFYYNRAGVVADLALIANVFFVLGVLTSLKATLTLPGIAGIVLTIGMSVDANVLIYERIREELSAGKGLKLAIAHAYSKNGAMPSIIDANITTLLTGIILLVFGTGPIQGFATTLIIGILTSLFSAIFVTRLFFEWSMSGKTPKMNFSNKVTANILKNANYVFVAKRKIFYVISGVLIVISLGSLATRQLDFGVDFKGGRTYQVRFDQPIEAQTVREALTNVFVNEDGIKQEPEVKLFGSSNQLMITTKYLIDSEAENSDAIVEERLNEGLASVNQNFDILRSQKVEPTIADDIKQSAVWAVVFALLVIFLYILIRFRKYQYSVGAVIAMTHDVIIVLGIFSLGYGLLPFSLEIDQAFIAAILTVVGYSINDTVVVFDRIREYLGIHKKQDYEKTVNSALNSTLSRTVNTSLSTFFVLLMIFIFGGEVIRGFVFALMIGVVVGTYSSVCVATPVMIDLQTKSEKAKKH